jgi:hypothetical protein
LLTPIAHYAAEASDANNPESLDQCRPPLLNSHSHESSSSAEPWMITTRSSFSHPTRSTPFDPNPKMQDQENDSKKAKDEG